MCIAQVYIRISTRQMRQVRQHAFPFRAKIYSVGMHKKVCVYFLCWENTYLDSTTKLGISSYVVNMAVNKKVPPQAFSLF